MEQQRNREGHGQEKDLGKNKTRQLPTPGTRHSVRANAAEHHVTKIVKQMPLNDVQSVEWPKVEVLPPVKTKSLLMRREPAEETEVNVGVMAGDVDIGMMNHHML